MIKSLFEFGRAAISDLDAVFAKLPDNTSPPKV